MPGSPSTGQGGQFGGPRYGWGDVPGGGARSADSGLDRGRYAGSPEAGLHRGEWQWRGHGPSAQQSYGWDYQGGVGRDEITQRTEARMGSSFQARMAQERGGGLPRGRYAVDFDRLGERTGGGRHVDYDRGWQGRTGGMPRGGTGPRYGGDYGGGGYASSGGHAFGGGSRGDSGGGYASGGHTLGGGGRTGRGGYGRDFRADHGRERGYGGGMRAGGGYGARGYDRGMRGRTVGGYGGDYSRPLSAEFFRGVEHW